MADAAAWAAPANHKKKRRKQLTQSLNGHDAVGFPKPSQVEAVVSAVATDGQRSRGWDMVRPKVQLNAGKRRVADLQPDVSDWLGSAWALLGGACVRAGGRVGAAARAPPSPPRSRPTDLPANRPALADRRGSRAPYRS